MRTVFILSPAHCGGPRAQLLFNPNASFELAARFRGSAVTVREVFSFLSGLYFRGKAAYAKAFGNPPRGIARGLVITTNRGLLPLNARITMDELREMGGGDIDPTRGDYREPLMRDVARIAGSLGKRGRVVLLGSIATGKYVDVLLELLGERLMFPEEFIGRGDMSRGGLMLRCVDHQRELTYIPVMGATRRGGRPPKLAPRVTHGSAKGRSG